MTQYTVHLYREMRVSYAGIEADTPEAAAAIAHDRTTGEADNIEDCDGEDLSALVDVAGDEAYSQSVMIDFEAERARKAAAALLNACRMVVERWENGDLAEAARTCQIAVQRATDTSTPSLEGDIHALLVQEQQVAAIWGVPDVQEIRPDLTADQAWQVLHAAGREHDAMIGINREVLACHADMLFGPASTSS